MDNLIEEFADTIWLLTDIECGSCHCRFAELEGQTEPEVWAWAQRTAEAAYRAGWRHFPDRILCPACIHHENAA